MEGTDQDYLPAVVSSCFEQLVRDHHDRLATPVYSWIGHQRRAICEL